MQSVEISGLKEVQKRLEGYPEAMKKARSEFFEEAGREMLSTVRRRIGGQGYVANVQEVYTGSGDGYAAVRAKADTELLHHQRAGKRAQGPRAVRPCQARAGVPTGRRPRPRCRNLHVPHDRRGCRPPPDCGRRKRD